MSLFKPVYSDLRKPHCYNFKSPGAPKRFTIQADPDWLKTRINEVANHSLPPPDKK